MQSAACPQCGFAPREIPAEYWGRKVKCPKCKEAYRLPIEPPSAPPPPQQELLPAIPAAPYIEPTLPAMMPQFPTSPAMPNPGTMSMEQLYAQQLASNYPPQPYAPYPPQHMPPQQYAPQQPQIIYMQAPAPTVHVTNVNTNVNKGGGVKHNSWANVALLMGLCAPVFGWIPMLGMAWCAIGMIAALGGLLGASHSYGAGRSFLGGLVSFVMFFPAMASTGVLLMQ